MTKATLISWLAVALVFLAEHLIMTRIYGKMSALQRLRRMSDSTKTDLVFWVFYYFLWGNLLYLATFLFSPDKQLAGGELVQKGAQQIGIFAHDDWAQLPLIWLVSLLAVDFVTYVSHRLMHEVPLLWNMHKIHHASTEMTILNGTRIAIAERVFTDAMSIGVVTLLLGVPNAPMALPVLLLYRVIDLIQHSSLPWDYGVFGFVIASPRFHQMHHSCELADHDANYGNIFSVWDYLFGSVAPRYRISPAVADTCRLGATPCAGDSGDQRPVAAGLAAHHAAVLGV